MTEQIQKITQQELSLVGRELFENLVAQYRKILQKNNATTIKELINSNTESEDLREAISILRELKHLSTSKDSAEQQLGEKIKEKLRNHPEIEYLPKRVWGFSEGRAIVNDDGFSYYVDYKGNIICEDYFEEATPFEGGIAHGRTKLPEAPHKTYIFIDRDGNHVGNENGYDAITTWSEDIMAVQRARGEWTYIRREGSELTSSQEFYDARPFSCGLGLIQLRSGIRTFIEITGRIRQKEYTNALSYKNNRALVLYEGGGPWQIIDIDGNDIDGMTYNEIIGGYNTNGHTAPLYAETDIGWVQLDEGYEPIFEEAYEEIKFILGQPYHAVKQNGEYTFRDHKGNRVGTKSFTNIKITAGTISLTYAETGETKTYLHPFRITPDLI